MIKTDKIFISEGMLTEAIKSNNGWDFSNPVLASVLNEYYEDSTENTIETLEGIAKFLIFASKVDRGFSFNETVMHIWDCFSEETCTKLFQDYDEIFGLFYDEEYDDNKERDENEMKGWKAYWNKTTNN